MVCMFLIKEVNDNESWEMEERKREKGENEKQIIK